MKNFLHKKCLEKDVTQSWVALRAGITRSHFSKIANNHLEPRVSTAIRIANVFKCDVEDLFILD